MWNEMEMKRIWSGDDQQQQIKNDKIFDTEPMTYSIDERPQQPQVIYIHPPPGFGYPEGTLYPVILFQQVECSEEESPRVKQMLKLVEAAKQDRLNAEQLLYRTQEQLNRKAEIVN